MQQSLVRSKAHYLNVNERVEKKRIIKEEQLESGKY